MIQIKTIIRLFILSKKKGDINGYIDGFKKKFESSDWMSVKSIVKKSKSLFWQ